MEIIKYLLENFDLDGHNANDLAAAKAYIQANFSADDAVEFANILITINELPKELTQAITNMI